MRSSEKEAFCEIVAAMAVVHGKPADAPLFAGWWMAMSDWEFNDFQDAARVVMKTAKWMPTPAVFHELQNASKPTAGEAWSTAISRCTSWRNGQKSGDVIDRAAAAVGGYRAIAMADIETALPHIERRFKEAFEQMDDAETVRQALPNLAPAPGINYRDGGFTKLAAPTAGSRPLIGHLRS